MSDLADLELIVRSRVPIVLVETHEENRALDMFRRLALTLQTPTYRWTVTEGLRRMEVELGAQASTSEPERALRHIKAVESPGIYVLVDFHPYLDDPVNRRLLKEIAHAYAQLGHTVVLLSPRLELPAELGKLAARFQLSLPDEERVLAIVREEALAWSRRNGNRKVKTDSRILQRLVANLTGLTSGDVRRLARKAIYDDGAITDTDLPEVMKAKYELIGGDGLLTFEYDTQRFADVGGMANAKRWLSLRRAAFHGEAVAPGLEPPRGVMLLGVQGCGKSLLAKAVAGIFAVPLLRLDFGALYDKFYGESEKNLREALRSAEVMAPCVLWADEIEKGIAADTNDGGTSRRVLGTLLTWMAERDAPVFMVATANDITRLPPELIRKGRFDEIFFVDLPDASIRTEILRIHLRKRGLAPGEFDLPALTLASEGFSGAEIEQAVVSALYVAYADGGALTSATLEREFAATRPLAVVMAEQIDALRQWAARRTVPAG
jgi:SpoVK/Ycf46/Vps4 family AAA+-type ATPase